MSSPSDGPKPDYTIPVSLTADEWEAVCESLAIRRRHRFDVLRDKIVDQTVTEAEPTGQLIDPADYPIMQRVHPQTGEPIGPPIDTRKPADRLVPGRKYRVVYQIPVVHRVPRAMVAQFIGEGQPGELDFSGRPVFGTTSLKPDWILDVSPVPDHERCYADRKAPAG